MSTTRRQAEYLAEQGERVTVVANEAPDGWAGIDYVKALLIDTTFWIGANYLAEGISRRLPKAFRRFSLQNFTAQYRFPYSASKIVAQLNRRSQIDACVCVQHFCGTGLARPEFPPFVLVAHGDIFEHPQDAFSIPIGKLYKCSAFSSYRTARHVVTVSRRLRERAIACGASPERVSVIPNGICDEEIIGCDSADAGRREKFEILFVGRLSAEKAVDVALHAVGKLNIPSFRFRVIGDGPMRTRLEHLAGSLGLCNRVEFLGYIPRRALHGYYESSDVVLLPSLSEAQGVIILEAFACGKPVVASNVGGIPDVVVDGRNGLLVTPGDVEGLAGAILRLWQDPGLRTAMSYHAREVAREYAWPSLLRRFHLTLRQAIAERNAEAEVSRAHGPALR